MPLTLRREGGKKREERGKGEEERRNRKRTKNYFKWVHVHINTAQHKISNFTNFAFEK